MKLQIKFDGPFDFEKSLIRDQIPSYLFRRVGRTFVTCIEVLGEDIPIRLFSDLTFQILSREKVEKLKVDGMRSKLTYFFWPEFRLSELYEKLSRNEKFKQIIDGNYGMRPLRSYDLDFAIIVSILLQDVSDREIDKALSMISEIKWINGIQIFKVKRIRDLMENVEESKDFPTLYRWLRRMLDKKFDVETLWNKSTEKIVDFFQKCGVNRYNGELIALYGFGREDAFPIDEEIGNRFNQVFDTSWSLQEIYQFVKENFAGYCGAIWLYLRKWWK
ncbi:MAG: hypothetical protein QW507_00360 [Candidatus Nanoarchaeia archaeon]|nr:hypothetical protein [Candidatus Haiyanarchaeum thermophilum]MCW1302966.1 hypothetical protein [Candidatus Haiyanarchaeum thermophilum]MCW1303644.1 hypothetical protein [Candidatus Haiyanarchaeum thermophilum]MCW1306325.1 hypothetical protein [Candidatus Haiyanarchaeum thermophilum]MCW1307165.1 hypothetical protein [Candidatus Haiyanarchaeum thermophilum]